jgi:hypothetical protein
MAAARQTITHFHTTALNDINIRRHNSATFSEFMTYRLAITHDSST